MEPYCQQLHMTLYQPRSLQIEGKAVKRGLPLRFHDKCDHLDSKLHDYKVGRGCCEYELHASLLQVLVKCLVV